MVPLFAAKKYTKMWAGHNGRQRYAELFRTVGNMFGANPNKPVYRIIIPVDKSFSESAKYSPVEADVLNAFHGTKFKLDNYYLGVAYDTENKRNMSLETALTIVGRKAHAEAARKAAPAAVAKKLAKLQYSVPGEEPGDPGKHLSRYKVNANSKTAYDEKLHKERTFDDLAQVLEWTRVDKTLNQVREDPVRANSALVDRGGMGIVVTRHAVDVMSLSTGRAWDRTTCLRLEYSRDGRGGNAHYIPAMVKFGAIVVYGIRLDDPNIERPLCRTTLCPFVNTADPDDVILVPTSRKYGEPFPGYMHTINRFLDIVNAGNKGGTYKLVPYGLYTDVSNEQKHPVWSQDDNIKEWCKKFGITNYKIRKDGRVDVDGDVRIEVNSSDMLSGMLPLKFGRVTGNFIVGPRSTAYDPLWFKKALINPKTEQYKGSGLTTLKGFPEYVGKDLDISGNPVETLADCPQYVGGNFLAMFISSLSSLQGMPRYVGGNVDVASSEIKSIRGSDGAHIHGALVLAYTKITHMDGKPQVDGAYVLSFTKLRTTLGLPDVIHDDLLMRNCHNIRDLLGMPKLIEGNFSATECIRVHDLRGMVKTRINGCCWFNIGRLEHMDYYPAYVGRAMQVFGHRLAKETKHPPTVQGPFLLGRSPNPTDPMKDPDPNAGDKYFDQLKPGDRDFYEYMANEEDDL